MRGQNFKHAKPNFVPWNRNWVTVRHHAPVILKPLLAGILLALIWRYLFVTNDIRFSALAEEPILHLILPLIGFVYVIFAGVAIGSVFEQYRIISKCVVKKDMDTFLLYRDEQLPIIMHILVIAPSVIIMIFVLLFDYQGSLWVGASAVFSVAFMFVLIWVIATELDDFRKSIWFREKIPAQWYEVDIDTYFKGGLRGQN